MSKNLIHSTLTNNFAFSPTKGQENLLVHLSEFLSGEGQKDLFLLKGYAGTGKTTVVNALTRTLEAMRRPYVLMAPTGRAAKVISSYTSRAAFTIHKQIYRQQSGRDGLGRFVLDKNKSKNTLFIVDEASMIGDRSAEGTAFGSGNLLGDLHEYVESGSNCRLLLIGDTAQLPPVNTALSPALDNAFLRASGYDVREVILTDVVRQAKGSGILENATSLRTLIAEGGEAMPVIGIRNYSDIIRISSADLIEELENSYSRYGEDETLVITRSNKRANRYNMGIRNQILWKDEELSIGDLMMSVKNNYRWVSPDDGLLYIANGDIGRITRIVRYENLYSRRFADVYIDLPDYKHLEIEARIMLDTLSIETASLPLNEQKEFFQTVLEDYADIDDRKKQLQMVLENPFYNALQVKYAWALTCHKAQGGQWKSVFVDPGFFREDMINREYLRWLYTAFTRATEKLFLVNFPDEFFQE